MAYINTGNNLPGILELLLYKGASGKALSNLAQTLLHGPSGLSPGERELIASYVSHLNECDFCEGSHRASSAAHLLDGGKAASCIMEDPTTEEVSEKLKFLLKIAAKVQAGGKKVLPEDVTAARLHGATDEDVHDTVLIAAAFCMFNRYVDGLGTDVPEDQEEYVIIGKVLAKFGYRYPPKFLRKTAIRFLTRWRSKRKQTQEQELEMV